MHRLACGVGLCAFLTLPATAQDWTLHSGGSVSQVQFGSEDNRYGFLVGIQRSRFEKRLTLGKTPLQEVVELYGLLTHGGGLHETPRNATWAVGGLYTIRWTTLASRPYGAGIEVGWGLQWANQETYDLNIKPNSTPTVGARFWSGDLSLTIRLMHISNAGTVPPNRGQNQWQFLVGYRF